MNQLTFQSLMNLLMNTIVYNDKLTINIDIELTSKRDLYNYYGITIKKIPYGYKVKMRYNRINSKRGRLYKLMKK